MFVHDRGSTCCVDILHQGQRYLLGISHPKTPYPGKFLPSNVVPNTYFSRFYAFQDQPPYTVVARTGKFCLGYPAKDDNSQQHPLWDLTASNRTHDYLMFGGTHMRTCPRIHFVLGMVDKYNDDDKIVVSYGVGDCLSRFVELDKADIAKLLWNPE